MQNEDWKIGESLDAFNDLLYGGIGELQSQPEVQLVWREIDKAEMSLGIDTTKLFYQSKLENPSQYNTAWAHGKLEELNSGKGQTYFDMIIEIIESHPDIELIRC